ncbi:MAG: type II/IV secretion system protein [Candidatus Pacebacteria bacterium]|nr:type II/IV secretion system protein [Candidatus Paceibacterota bacterium]
MPQEYDDKIDRNLDEFRAQEEEVLAETLAGARYGVSYVDLSTTTIQNEALRLIPEEEARRVKAASFKVFGKEVHIAVISPEDGEVKVLAEDFVRRGFKPTLFMSSHASLEKAWARYKEISFAQESKRGGLDVSSETLAELKDKIKTLDDVKKIAEEITTAHDIHATSRLLEVVLAGAISLKCSDVHIEPEEKRMRVRYRLDGVLRDILFLDMKVYHLLNSRIKLVAGMKLTITTKAQDGRFSVFIDGVEISMRTSTVPGSYGESIVMRILDPKSIQVELESMGIEPKLFSIINAEIQKPNGLILITGPTGSGKTTTLYAFLRKIYSPELKMITIEDPVEYHLAGITQTQIDKGFSFLDGLRAALRQDPDVIMVGEIRDPETAKIAVESALTGHIVFSTLHTNNAAGVIPRLIDLDVNAKILVSALSLSIAQRLVRVLCKECRVERPVKPEEETLLRKILKGAGDAGKNIGAYNLKVDQPIKLYTAPGCHACSMTGFKGRMGIFEAIMTDEEIEKIIPSNPSEREIKRIANKQGIFNMKEDGVVKILSGITSIEEVQSVVDLTEED